MRAAVLTAPGLLDLTEQPEPPDPGPGEVLVAVRRVGICGTDYHAYAGRQNFIAYPCVLGHELAVEVLAVGPGVTSPAVGEQCAVMPYLSCGSCAPCRRGRTNCCERIKVLGVTHPGGLRERMLLPAAQLFPAPGLSLDQLVLVETLGIGWHALSRARSLEHEGILVLGAGPIGLAVAQSAVARSAPSGQSPQSPPSARVLLADVAPRRVAFARSLGLDAVLVPELHDAVRDRFDAAPTLVLDASGNRDSMERAFGLVGHGGTLVMVGHTTAELTFHNPTFHARELEVLGSRNATPRDWHEVIAAVSAGDLDASAWVSHRSDLASVVEDLPRLAADPGDLVKAVVEIPVRTSGAAA